MTNVIYWCMVNDVPPSEESIDRRQLMKGVGTGAAALAVAGCSGPSDGDGETGANDGSGSEGEGDSSPTATGSDQMTAWSFSVHHSILKETARRYQEENDVSIGTQSVPGNNLGTRLTSAIQSDSGIPNTSFIRASSVFGYVENDYLTSLNNLVSSHSDKIFECSLERCRAQSNPLEVSKEGDFVTVPHSQGSYLLLYNRNIFEEAGLPTDPKELHEEIQTWKQFIEAGKKVEKNTDATFMANDRNARNDLFNLLCNQLHGKYYKPLDTDGSAEFDFTQPANVKAAKINRAIKEAGITTNMGRLSDQHIQALRNDEVAVHAAQSWQQFVFKGGGNITDAGGALASKSGDFRGLKPPLPQDLVDGESHLPSGKEVKRGATGASGLEGIPVGHSSAVNNMARDFLEYDNLSRTSAEVMLEAGLGVTFLNSDVESMIDQEVEYFGGQPINRYWTESSRDSPVLHKEPTGDINTQFYQTGKKILAENVPIEDALEEMHNKMVNTIKAAT